MSIISSFISELWQDRAERAERSLEQMKNERDAAIRRAEAAEKRVMELVDRAEAAETELERLKLERSRIHKVVLKALEETKL